MFNSWATPIVWLILGFQFGSDFEHKRSFILTIILNVFWIIFSIVSLIHYIIIHVSFGIIFLWIGIILANIWSIYYSVRKNKRKIK